MSALPPSGRPQPPTQPAEFVALFLAEQQRIYAFIVTLVGNTQDAEDLMQETASVLFSKFDEYRPGTRFFTWACTTARYLVLNHRRKKAHREVLLDDDVLALLADVSAADADIAAIRSSALHDCLDRLDPEDRKLFERRYVGSVAVKFLASELGRPAESVCRSLGRIRRRLADCIGRAIGMPEQKGEDA